MARLLVIPDIHNATGWADSILERFEGETDRTVFLGDYFDSWNDGERMAAASAEWLRLRAESPRRIFLFGNHDLSYFAPGPATLCSGWTEEKDAAIAAVMRPGEGLDHWGRLRCFHFEEGWLFTHAGLRKDLFQPAADRPSVAAMESLFERSLANIRRKISDPVFGAGEYRLGTYAIGGVTWLDFNEAWEHRELLVHYHQVVGHSVLPAPRTIIRDAGSDFALVPLDRPDRGLVRRATQSFSCIDARGRAFAIVDTANSALAVYHCEEGGPGLVIRQETAIRFKN